MPLALGHFWTNVLSECLPAAVESPDLIGSVCSDTPPPTSSLSGVVTVRVTRTPPSSVVVVCDARAACTRGGARRWAAADPAPAARSASPIRPSSPFRTCECSALRILPFKENGGLNRSRHADLKRAGSDRASFGVRTQRRRPWGGEVSLWP